MPPRPLPDSIMLRPDGEPALVKVAETIRDKREKETGLHPSPHESPQSTGGAENSHYRFVSCALNGRWKLLMMRTG